MKKIGLVLCSCLLWTTVVNAQSPLYPQSNWTGARGRSLDNQGAPPLNSAFVERKKAKSGFPTTITRNFSSSAPVAAGYEEYAQAPFEDAGSQVVDAAAPGTQSLNPFASLTRTEDVSGLDLYGILPYATYINYGSGSLKRDGETVGFYGYASTTLDLVELGIDDTFLRFRNGFNFTQQDYTLVWNNYGTPNFRWRAGVHYMSNNDSLTNQGLVGIFGAHYFKDKYEVGTDVYLTNYQHYAPQLFVTEISPHITVPLGLGKGELRGYYIHSSIDLGLGKRSFFSAEGRLSQDVNNFNFGLYGWGGEQTFAVRNDGFVVYNLNEKHRAGFGGEATYKFTEHTKFTARAGQELFSDFTTNTPTHQTVVTLLLSHTF